MNFTTAGWGSLGFGAAGIGNLYRAMDDAVAADTIEAAWRGGIRHFDTAPHYGLGLSERRLGAALAGKPRDSFLLSSKVGRLVVSNPDSTPNDLADGFDVSGELTRQWDPTESGVRRSIEESLDRLGVDRIDIAYLHDPDVYDLESGITEALPALAKLRDEGLVQAIGVGTNSAEAAAECIRRGNLDLVMLAGRYTLLEQPALAELLPLCLDHGVGVVNVGVYNSGLLARNTVPDDAHYNYAQAPRELVGRARQIAAICNEFNVELPAAALAFSLRHSAVQAVVVGASGPEQMQQNLDRSAVAIPEDLWVALAERELIPG